MEFLPLISIIIPIYNAENYLEECLDSVVNQTYKKLEIILIDDGSNDNSFNISKYYADKDSRIMLIQQKNLGAGNARNTGIKLMKGDYVWFLDADDYIALNACEILVENINKNQSDIIVMGHKNYDMKSKTFQNYIPNERFFDKTIVKKVFNHKDIKYNFLWSMDLCAWDKFYSSNFLIRNKILFENFSGCDDVTFVMHSSILADKISLLNQTLMTHRIAIDNSQSSKNNINKHPNSFVFACRKLVERLKNPNFPSVDIEHKVINFAIGCCIHLSKHLSKDSQAIAQISTQIFFLDELNLLDYPNDFFEDKKLHQEAKRLCIELLEKRESKGSRRFGENIKQWQQIEILKFNTNTSKQKIGAPQRLKNHLAYKLGFSIIQTKTFFQALKLPFLLLFITLKHKKDMSIYKSLTKINPCLILPPLESYDDYAEALKIKEYLSYKFGKALIENPFTFIFKMKKIYRNFKADK